MKIIFANTIIFVKDIEKSKKFYSEILGMKIIDDYGTIVFFENRLVLHSAKSILKTVFKKMRISGLFKQGRKNILIYFETDRLEEFYNKTACKVKIIHGIQKQAWGQNVFRFYDPDGHMVEFGETFRIEELMNK
ncbi:MAG: VOC family protein [Spirochaetes bacterium]|nr:VOC family protein [Spirochaetota bacterium]